jgi:hypothetical protein
MARFSIRQVFILTALIAVELALLVALSRQLSEGALSLLWFALPWLVASGLVSSQIHRASTRLSLDMSLGASICIGTASVTFVQSALVAVWLLSMPHR